MPNHWFKFKQFVIRQDKCAMKVGTDGVLLGAWAGKGGRFTRILDVGTGTGLIALMLAQRFQEAVIEGIEIDQAAAAQAEENVRESPWLDRIRIIQHDFRALAGSLTGKYDLIVSNPPFFAYAPPASSAERTMARHGVGLKAEDILQRAPGLLSSSGRLSLIVPERDGEALIDCAEKAGMHPCRQLKIRPAPGKEIKRVLWEFSFEKTKNVEDEITLETGGRHGYSEEYRRLTADFYLYF